MLVGQTVTSADGQTRGVGAPRSRVEHGRRRRTLTDGSTADALDRRRRSNDRRRRARSHAVGDLDGDRRRGPRGAAAMVVGVAIALLQALTQVQEMTLTFVPKLVVVFVVFSLTASFIGAQFYVFTEMVYAHIEHGYGAFERPRRRQAHASLTRDCRLRSHAEESRALSRRRPYGQPAAPRRQGHRLRGRHHARPVPVLSARPALHDRLRAGVFDRAVGADPDGGAVDPEAAGILGVSDRPAGRDGAAARAQHLDDAADPVARRARARRRPATSSPASRSS